jgi:predicted dehydrogenase
MRRKLRLGIIGAGAIGRRHLNACQACRGVEVTAVCDVDAERTREAAAAFDVPEALAGHRQLLAGDRVDAVSICTPNNTHMSIALAALKAGKHVLCEKPLALNARQARRMVRAAEEAGLLLMTAQSARYSAAAQFVKRLADAGRFGEIYYAKALWLRRSGIPTGWFQDAAQSGGGPLIDLGVHAVDLMWWIMGQPRPVTAFGVTFDRLGSSGQGMGDWGVGYNPAAFSVEDMVAALVRFEDGRALGVDISWAAHTSDLYWLRLFGAKGGAQINPELVTYEADGRAAVNSFAKLPEQDTYATEIQHFADCIRRGRQPISSGAQAVVVTAMLDAITKAASTGRAVRVSAE